MWWRCPSIKCGSTLRSNVHLGLRIQPVDPPLALILSAGDSTSSCGASRYPSAFNRPRMRQQPPFIAWRLLTTAGNSRFETLILVPPGPWRGRPANDRTDASPSVSGPSRSATADGRRESKASAARCPLPPSDRASRKDRGGNTPSNPRCSCRCGKGAWR